MRWSVGRQILHFSYTAIAWTPTQKELCKKYSTYFVQGVFWFSLGPGDKTPVYLKDE